MGVLSGSGSDDAIAAEAGGGLTETGLETFKFADISLAAEQLLAASVGSIMDADPDANFVAENSPAGTYVGVTVSAIDPDPDDAVSYTLYANPADLFAIDEVTGEVFTTGPIDHETNGGDVAVGVAAVSTDGTVTEQLIHITIGDVDEAPVASDFEALAYEGGATTFIPENFQFSDEDAGVNEFVSVTILSLPSQGTLSYNGAVLTPDMIAAGFSLTPTELTDNSLTFTPDPNATATRHYAAFEFSVATSTNSGAPISSAPATMSIDVWPINDTPVIVSNGGGDTADVAVAENTTAVTTVLAADIDPFITYGIDGGADASLFQIDQFTGALSFIVAPDFEAPADANGDNVYDVVVRARNSGGCPIPRP